MVHARIRRGASVVTATALLGLTAGCSAVSGGSASTPSTASARAVKSITWVNPLPSYPAFNTVGTCLAAEAKKYGWKANEVGTTGTTVDNQAAIDLISQAIVSGTDAIVAVPITPQQFAPVFKQARQKGISVIAVNAGSSDSGQQTQVGTDQAQSGATVADGLGSAAPDAHVGFLSLSAASAPFSQNIAGFKAEAAKKFPQMKMVDSEFDNGDSTKDVDIFRNMLAAHPDITALYAVEGAAVSGAVTAVTEAGRAGSIKVVSLDLTDQTRSLIESGQLYGVADQGWCDMGTESVDAVKSLSEGKTLPATIPTKVTFYSKANLPSS